MFYSLLLKIKSIFLCSFFIVFSAQAQTVAILDTGINITEGLSVPSNLVVSQHCFSKEDAFFSNSPNNTYHYISLCPNGKDQDLTSKSATIPRSVRLRFGDDPFVNYPHGIVLKHGNLVSNALYSFNRTVKHKPVQTNFYDQSFTTGSDCVINNGKKIGCYNGIINDVPVTMIEALKHLARFDSNSISAVVIASGFTDRLGRASPTACSRSLGQPEINTLHNKGIAVVAALQNQNLSSNQKSWPNCLDKVINVGNSSGRPIGIGANGIDFYALNSSGSARGNSFSAPRVAGAMALLHSANPSSSVAQKIEALTKVNSRIRQDGYLRPFVKSSTMSSAIAEIKKVTGTPPPTNPPPTTPPPQPPTPPGQTAVLGFTDNTRYTGEFTFTVNLNGATSTASTNTISAIAPFNANIGITNVRDIKLSFDGKYRTIRDPNSLAGLDIEVNGVRRITFNTLQYFANNPVFRKHSFMLNRNWLKSGDNTITIKRSSSNPPSSGVFLDTTNIRMDYNSPIKMKLGQKITSLYGHRVGSKKHLTGLRVEFASPSKDIEFSATGFDIDSATEIAVFLNQKRIGYLKRGSSSRYNAGDVFKLKKEDFVTTGVNTIEFVQTSSSDRETWGVTNMELRDIQVPNITGALMLLLDD